MFQKRGDVSMHSGREVITEEKYEFQRTSHVDELHNQLVMGMKKRKESRVEL